MSIASSTGVEEAAVTNVRRQLREWTIQSIPFDADEVELCEVCENVWKCAA
jgi:hypothetical protein